MAFKAVIHYPARQEQMQEIYKTITQFRAEKAAKHLAVIGVTYGTIRECMQQEKVHNKASKVS